MTFSHAQSSTKKFIKHLTLIFAVLLFSAHLFAEDRGLFLSPDNNSNSLNTLDDDYHYISSSSFSCYNGICSVKFVMNVFSNIEKLPKDFDALCKISVSVQVESLRWPNRNSSGLGRFSWEPVQRSKKFYIHANKSHTRERLSWQVYRLNHFQKRLVRARINHLKCTQVPGPDFN